MLQCCCFAFGHFQNIAWTAKQARSVKTSPRSSVYATKLHVRIVRSQNLKGWGITLQLNVKLDEGEEPTYQQHLHCSRGIEEHFMSWDRLRFCFQASFRICPSRLEGPGFSQDLCYCLVWNMAASVSVPHVFQNLWIMSAVSRTQTP